MKSINAYLLVLTLCFAGVVTADHKPGHPTPTTGTELSDLSCAEGQTIAILDGVWVCADFPVGDGVGLDCAEGQTIVLFNGAWVCADFPALTGLVRVQADYFPPSPFTLDGDNLSSIATQEVFAECPAGTKVVGGGYIHFYGGSTGVIRDNLPTIPDLDGITGWLVAGTNFDGQPWRLSAVAMCADAD